jgi:hypothetical protein
MYLHKIKIEAPYYAAVREGRKNFVIRRNDRGYNAGDIVHLWALDENGLIDSYKPTLEATIGYVTQYEQKENYVVFSLLNVKEV